MGTLTGNSEQLETYCEHKLPTSCRLTSIPRCCACADERAHSATYPTYIDGVGFVPRGNRWQRYCWFCKEFWENRVAATNLRPTQTRIPEVPDQRQFLEKWFEFHRGYRVVQKENGTEERQAVLGEPWMDVSPGQLPRTLDELRAGAERSAEDQQQHIVIEESAQPTGPSLDETLDQMLGAAESEDVPPSQPSQAQFTENRRSSHVAGQVMQPTGSRNREYQARRISALQRELQRLRLGVERVLTGLRDLGEAAPEHAEATERLARLDRSLTAITLDNMSAQTATDEPADEAQAPARNDRSAEAMQRRIELARIRQQEMLREQHDATVRAEDANQYLLMAQQRQAEAEESLHAAENRVRASNRYLVRLQNDRRTAENYRRVFGSREEMEREDYVSPIGGLFTRAWDRFRAAEETRREERTLRQVLDDEQRVAEALRAASNDSTDNQENTAANTAHEDRLNEYYTMLRQQDWTQRDPSSTQSNFPQSMLDAVRDLSEEERQARIENIASADAQRAVRGDGSSTRGTNVLEHLLRDTPEPERSAIIARMTENGTAQALAQSSIGTSDIDRMNLLRSLQSSLTTGADDASSSSDEEETIPQGLDVGDDNRPEPRNDEDLTIRMDCKVCYTQMADTACLPCGHLVLCQWCSEQHSPVMAHDKTRPRRPVGCPVCRKRVRQKVRIYRP